MSKITPTINGQAVSNKTIHRKEFMFYLRFSDLAPVLTWFLMKGLILELNSYIGKFFFQSVVRIKNFYTFALIFN
ncbi:MAG: hypothetical protein EA409_08855 [Saprospirales bacterium]|nr:MAG: hypothetical protein EA409_08855 [Saprospirales bacterium]